MRSVLFALGRGWVPVLLFICSACSGGGGSGTSQPPPFLVSFDRPSVSFTYQQGQTSVAPQIVNASWTGTPPSSVYLAATADGTAIDPTIVVAISETSAKVTVRAKIDLVPGQYDGQITILVCADQACAQPIGGTPKQVSYSVTVTQLPFAGPGNIQKSYVFGTPLPSATPLTINSSAGAWTATASQPWITLSAASGTGAAILNVNVDPTKTASLGAFSGTVTLSSAAGSFTAIVGMALSLPTLDVSTRSIDRSVVFGAPIAGDSVSVMLSNSATMPMIVTRDKPWIVIGSPTANAPGSFTVSIDPTQGVPLTPGNYTGSIHVVATDGRSSIPLDISVSLALAPPTLSTPPAALIGGSNGRSMSSVPVYLNLNTGTNAYPFTVALTDSQSLGWLTSNATSGTVGGNKPANVSLGFDRSRVAPGSYSGTATFKVTINGSDFSKSVPVEMNFESHRLVPEYNGVAFSKFPSRSLLARDIKISSAFDLTNVPWTATSNQSWLTVTPSGLTGGWLHLAATPPSAPGFYEASVTISSTDAAIERAENIRVGLYVGTADPINVNSASRVGSPQDLAINPVDPLAYAVDFYFGTVRVYDIYTGALVDTFAPPGITQAVSLGVTGDGKLLFVTDWETGNTVVLDAKLGTVVSTYTSFFPFRVDTHATVPLRPNGHSLVWLPSGEVWNVETGSRMRLFNSCCEHSSLRYEPIRGRTPDSKKYVLLNNSQPANIFFVNPVFTALNGKSLQLISTYTMPAYIAPAYSGIDLGVGASGTNAFMVDGGNVAKVTSIPLTGPLAQPDIVLPTNSNAAAVNVAWNGRVYFGLSYFDSGSQNNLFIYDETGSFVGSTLSGTNAGGRARRLMGLSGDLTRVVSIHNNPFSADPNDGLTISFFNLP